MFEHGVKDDVCWIWDQIGVKARVFIPQLVTIYAETSDKEGYHVTFFSRGEPSTKCSNTVKKADCFWTKEEMVHEQIVKSCHRVQKRIDDVTADHQKEVAALKKLLEK